MRSVHGHAEQMNYEAPLHAGYVSGRVVYSCGFAEQRNIGTNMQKNRCLGDLSGSSNTK